MKRKPVKTGVQTSGIIDVFTRILSHAGYFIAAEWWGVMSAVERTGRGVRDRMLHAVFLLACAMLQTDDGA
jgi:hypothetical protein